MNSNIFPAAPPALKTRLSTLVDAFEQSAYPLDLTSKLGKRRLFKKRVWAEKAAEGFLRIRVMPDWLFNLPSGRVALFQTEVIPEGTLETYIEQVQERFGVHLWLAPISLPARWSRGNWVSNYALHGSESCKIRTLPDGEKSTGEVIPFNDHASALYLDGLLGVRVEIAKQRLGGVA